ncbi:uncharacterized protein isoform X2 [Leptinotarsa decemlineata]|uniref:uncharacterized protein isoform X2 n=1 Tax=Leptinotarsa decemlineata TaxID=7539 RepID=UPI003D307CA3
MDLSEAFLPTAPFTESLINYLPAALSSFVKHEESKEIKEEQSNTSSYVTSTDLSESGRYPKEESNTWSDIKRPFVKLRKLEDLDLTEEEMNGILSDRMIAASLSYPEKPPETDRYVLCKCVIINKDISDLSALEKFRFIQYLDLSKNNLRSLESLGKMPFLRYLNVSHNFLTSILDFEPPFGLSYVDYTDNNLTEIPDLSKFWSISHLDLSRNEIREIKGLQNLGYLNYLDISHNLITKLENLNELGIKTLKMHHNQITNYENDENAGFQTLNHIRYVDLSNNSLKSLKFLQMNGSIESLNLSYNGISSLFEVYHLRSLPYLTRLDLSNNPISTDPFYFNVCIREVKQLRYLDDTEITAETKISVRTKQQTDPTQIPRENRMELLLLQQINKPCIGAHIVPYDQPPPKVIVLVGPPCSGKKNIAMAFVNSKSRLVFGRSHTTRPKLGNEVSGREYFFVSKEHFIELMRKGEFISTSEFNGNSYGIAHTELYQYPNSVVIFHTNIKAAITLKVSGVCPKLVLAMPSNDETHRNWLKFNYLFERQEYSTETRIKRCPNCVKSFLQKDSEPETFTIDSDEVLELIESSEDSIPTTSTEGSPSQNEKENDFIHINDTSSIISDQFVPCMQDEPRDKSVSMKSYAGILKTTHPLSGTRSNAVSFTETPFFAEKMESKRVSFNWLSTMDNGPCKHTQTSPVPEKSISDSCIMDNIPNKNNDINLLSVLSASRIAEKLSDKQETIYMTLAERFEQVQMDKLGKFFDEIIESRKEYLNLHWENPGLFRGVFHGQVSHRL